MNPTWQMKRVWLAIAPILLIGAFAPATAMAASDLSITKTDSADPATEGQELTYSITVANAGPDAAELVQVVDRLPSEVTLIAATASQGTCDNKGPEVTCDLGTLASGATATVAIRVTPKKVGQLSNTATVSATGADSAPQDNSDTEVTTVVAAGSGGGGGNTGATCSGKNATVVGTAGPDTLVGTDKNDVIVALAGDDIVRGLGGKDIVCVAGGNDTVFGAAGDDQVKGGAGNDQLRGGGGGDALRGGGGSDALFGEAGPDALSGGGGNDRCRGGAGRDTKRSC